MKKLFAVIFVLGAGMLGATSVLAHHSFAAEFDANAHVKLAGIVTKIQWQNPHAFFYIDVENEDGQYENWAIALGSPNALARRGWKRDTLHIGDEVTITGWQARDGSFKANARDVALNGGEVLYSDSNGQPGGGHSTDAEGQEY